MEKKKIILTTAVAVVVVAGGFWMLGGPEGKSTVDFATEAVTKGNVSNFITATGTIEPVTEVEVGTQVSGIIDKIYVDYNSVVKKGELIAEMDKVTLQSELQSALYPLFTPHRWPWERRNCLPARVIWRFRGSVVQPSQLPGTRQIGRRG